MTYHYYKHKATNHYRLGRLTTRLYPNKIFRNISLTGSQVRIALTGGRSGIAHFLFRGGGGGGVNSRETANQRRVRMEPAKRESDMIEQELGSNDYGVDD